MTKNLYASGEEYLKWIYKIQKEIKNVRSIDVAVYMGYSRSSVSIAVKKLQKDHFLTKDKKGILHLTRSGLEVGKKLYNRHKFLTNALTDLGVNSKVAIEDACRLEHVLSDVSFQRLKEYFNKTKNKE